MLPSSKAIVDRATIKSHLLSDPKDPFNRAPLTLEDVISCWFFTFSSFLLLHHFQAQN